MPVDLRPCNDDAQWDALLEAFPDATLFHTSQWLRFLAETSGWTMYRWLLNRSGRTVGLFPAFVGRKGGLWLAASPIPGACTSRLGPLLENGDDLDDTLAAMEPWLADVRADYVDILFAREAAADPLRRRGYTVDTLHTYLLDLSGGEEAVFNTTLHRVCRKAVRKARKSGVTIIESPLAEHIDRYIEMAHSTYERSHRPPPLSKEFLLAMEAALQSRGRARTLWAEHEGKLIACCIFGLYRQTVYSLDAAADRQHLEVAPNNLLHWELIAWAIREGLTTYDMVGANTPSIARFKSTFGPALVSYTYAWHTRTWRARVGRRLYRQLAPVVRAVRYAAALLRSR